MNHSQPLQRIRRQSLFLALVFLLALLTELWPQATPVSARPLAQEHCRLQIILFVSANRPLPPRDEPLQLYLTLLGNLVVVRNAREVQASDAIGKDLVIISESAESGEVNTKLRDVNVPILTWEGWLQDDLQMVENDGANYGEILGQNQIQIVNPKHPLAAGLNGTVTTVVNQENKFHWGQPNDNAIVVARDVKNEEHVMIYAYETGAKMAGLVAPARRVFIHNATGPNLSTAGLNLFLAAVDWAAGCVDEPAPATPTPSATATATAPQINTATATATPVNTATQTATVTQTATRLPSTTATPLPPTKVAPTMTATITPQPPATQTVQPTPTPSATATATLLSPTVTPTPSATVGTPAPPATLTLQKRDLLFVDADENGMVSPGDTLLYLITISNDGSVPVSEIELEDQPDPTTQLVADSVQSTHGTVELGNQPSDGRVVIAIGNLAPANTALVSLRVQVASASADARLANQAILRYGSSEPTGQQVLPSDDPDTQAVQDATITPLFNGAPALIRTFYLPLISR